MVLVDYNHDIFENLTETRRNHPKRLICAYLNINSLRYKVGHIKELLQKGTADILFLARKSQKIESSCSHDRSMGRLSCSMFCTDLV
jgi:hypothetical protein